MAWTVDFDPRAFKELEDLDRTVQKRIVTFIRERVLTATSPRDIGKPLTGDKAGVWRYRVGDYRLICRLFDDAKQIRVLRISHRKDVYR